ncbi:MAG TPA: hypothetical protein VMW87_02435 [Spirochaetia bacterium]|nr:hypothetical protein [Spirochaetia bacterium]
MTKKTKQTPNPLPCGCGAVGIRELDHGEAREQFSGIHIKHCPLHAAAPKLYAALKRMLPYYCEHLRGVGANPDECRTVIDARIALAKAKALCYPAKKA